MRKKQQSAQNEGRLALVDENWILDVKKAGQRKLFPQIACFVPAFVESSAGFCAAYTAMETRLQINILFSRLQRNPAAFQGHGAKGLGFGSADNFYFFFPRVGV